MFLRILFRCKIRIFSKPANSEGCLSRGSLSFLRVFTRLTQLGEKFPETGLLGDHAGQIGNRDALLFHRIAVPHGHRLVFERPVVDRNAERGSDRILTTVTLADTVFLVVMSVEIAF